ncbi:MAG: hypothetical protein EOO88_60155 [Pedobacter sp.]|nr:MAG: hypothetical protein EOO88_60155 [Pedobacter sp.]
MTTTVSLFIHIDPTMFAISKGPYLMKKFILAVICFVFCNGAFANEYDDFKNVTLGKQVAVPQLDAIVKDKKSGAPVSLTQGLAFQYCKDHQAHLPTIRELALYAQSQGAIGILPNDKCDKKDWEDPSKQYSPPFATSVYVRAKNLDGSFDEFCYDEKGYQPIDFYLMSSSRSLIYGENGYWLLPNGQMQSVYAAYHASAFMCAAGL